MIYLIYCPSFCDVLIIAQKYCEHMGIGEMAYANMRINAIYGLFVVSFLVIGLVLVGISYGYVFCAVFYLISQDVCHKTWTFVAYIL